MTGADRPPRIRLDSDQRRAAILDAARSHYAERGFSEVAVGEVARDAGASPALVFHYFGSKAGLYASVVADALGRLADDRARADSSLSLGIPARDRVRAWVLTHLEHVAATPRLWTTALRDEPPEAVDLRDADRRTTVEELRRVLRPTGGVRADMALWGFFGFLDAACAHWVDAGCPPDDKHSLADAALGALEGALGDWGR